MPRYGDRWRWSAIELQRAVDWLRAHCGSNPIRMADIERASLAVAGRTSPARVLRDRLVLADCLVVDTARGRSAEYHLPAEAEERIALAPDDDDPPDEDDPPAGAEA